MNSELNLNYVFSALAHPVRRDMVKRLAQGRATVNDLAAPFDMSLPAISKHIKVLEHAGLIERGKDAQFRPCQLNPSALQAVATWADAYRPIWETRFDQMDRILQSQKEDDDGR